MGSQEEFTAFKIEMQSQLSAAAKQVKAHEDSIGLVWAGVAAIEEQMKQQSTSDKKDDKKGIEKMCGGKNPSLCLRCLTGQGKAAKASRNRQRQ